MGVLWGRERERERDGAGFGSLPPSMSNATSLQKPNTWKHPKYTDIWNLPNLKSLGMRENSFTGSQWRSQESKHKGP
ncbi:unnamed protein product [Prunus armeniaca]